MKVTFLLIAINLVMFVVQMVLPAATDALALTPINALDGEYWQFISYMFLHGGTFHIMLNMFVLGIFGPGVEHHLGWRKYVALYFIAGLGSAFLHIILTGINTIQLIGASGAVFGVLTGYGMLYPRNWIIMFPGIPMPAILAIFVFAGLEIFYGVTGLQAGVANFGHLGGIITGLALMGFWKFTSGKVPVEEKAPREYEFIWE